MELRTFFRFNVNTPWRADEDLAELPGEALAQELFNALTAAGFPCDGLDMSKIGWWFVMNTAGREVSVEVIGQKPGAHEGVLICDPKYGLFDRLLRRPPPGAWFTDATAAVERALASSSVNSARAVTHDEFVRVTRAWFE